MANNNFRRFDGGIQIRAKLAADPATGKVGEIYLNSVTNSLRICVVGGNTPVWQDLKIASGTVDHASLRWDTPTQAWIEEGTVLIGANKVYGPALDNAPALEIAGSAAVSAAIAGGDVKINGGTPGAGAEKGKVILSGRAVQLDVAYPSDPVTNVQLGDVYYNTTNQQFKYWNGSTWLPLGSGSGGAYPADLHDNLTTTLPLFYPATIDGVSLQDGDEVLFSNLTSGSNQIYRAQFFAPADIIWTPVNAFNGLTAPQNGSQVIITGGTIWSYAQGVFDGTNWNFNNRLRFYNGGDYWEQSAIYTMATPASATTQLFSITAAGSENTVVKYSIQRGANKETGVATVTHNGTIAQVSGNASYIGLSGVQIIASLSLGQLIVSAVVDGSAGAANVKYMLERWSDNPGGPGGPPSYSYVGSTITAAGSTGQIQFNDSNNLAASPSLSWDNSNNLLSLGNMIIGAQKTAVIPDNQAFMDFDTVSDTVRHLIVEYGIERNGEYQTGRLLIASNGLVPSINDDSVFTATLGVTFNAVCSGGLLRVQASTTPTGAGATIRYSIKRIT